ncbi:MAG: YvcK family protein, partial [Thermoleophilia bacterium]|nr:YvcK family protein [Thermoleophilia bacterium]
MPTGFGRRSQPSQRSSACAGAARSGEKIDIARDTSVSRGGCQRESRRRAVRSRSVTRLTVLCGGLGGSRFVDSLARAAGPEAVTAVGNVGDDLEILGLRVSPDLDTVLYTLAGL